MRFFYGAIGLLVAAVLVAVVAWAGTVFAQALTALGEGMAG